MVPKEKTCKVNKPALNIFNVFTMNKQQVMKANNTFDLSASSKTYKSMGKDAVRFKNQKRYIKFFNPFHD